ncbi:MAG: trimethylamine methyltransferase family protein [Dehalobacterium sp.]
MKGYIKVLSDDEIYQIHLAALRILREIGLKIKEPQAVSLLKRNGCIIEGDRVRIPTHLVEEAVAQAPSTFTIYGRNPEYKAVMENIRVYIEPMIGRLNILDLETGRRRRTTLEDVANLIKLSDALEHFSTLHSGAIMPHIEGIPDPVAHVNGYLISLRNSSKIIKGSCRGKKVAQDCIHMAAIVAGGEAKLAQKPNVFTTANIISPLEYDNAMTEGLIEYAKHGLPIDIASEPQMGATSPVTIAGTLAQQTAEILGGVVIAQLVNPGTPVLMGTVGAAMDMRNGSIALGGVEAGIINVAHAQMARFYGIPSRGTGCNTESKCLDIQAGLEKASSMFMPVLAGINMLFYPGTLDHAKTISLESLVIDNEICGMALRAMKGVKVDDETLAVDIIDKVGPGQHYLGQKHTMIHLQDEQFIPQITNRQSYEDWQRNGSKDLWQRAKEEVKRILSTYQPLPLPEECEAELMQYVRYVEERELGRTLVK